MRVSIQFSSQTDWGSSFPVFFMWSADAWRQRFLALKRLGSDSAWQSSAVMKNQSMQHTVWFLYNEQLSGESHWAWAAPLIRSIASSTSERHFWMDYCLKELTFQLKASRKNGRADGRTIETFGCLVKIWSLITLFPDLQAVCRRAEGKSFPRPFLELFANELVSSKKTSFMKL